ncbi:MAG: excinuclease ABC subunit UvrA [Solibacillus sp.]
MDQQWIELIGARQNNLKNISLRIPKQKITVFTGVSGSGKSSIVFDTIAQEAGRQLNETFSNFVRLYLPRYQQPQIDSIHHLSPAVVVGQDRLGGNARSTVGTISDISPLFRVLYSRFATPSLGYGNAYSFNDPQGMCPACEGIGSMMTLNIDAAIDREKSLQQGAILLPGYGVDTYYWNQYAQSGFFDVDKPLKDYNEEEWHQLLYSEPQKVQVTHSSGNFQATYEGIVVRFRRSKLQKQQEASEREKKQNAQFLMTATCEDCSGTRYREEVLHSLVGQYSIHDLSAMQLSQLIEALKTFTQPEMQTIVSRISERVQSLIDIGLGYMTLNRETATLSGGESQRVKMVKYLSSTLTGMLYIFDEPSTGLHPRDVYRLNDLLRQIRDKGNTVLVVEHDPDVIAIADYIVDVGPGAGAHGGTILFSGPYEEFAKSDSITAQALHTQAPMNTKPRPVSTFIESKRSSLYNLKNVSLKIPEQVLTVVTGVAGSGKSTLVNEVFAKQYQEAIVIDQRPIHTNVRSNAATYLGMMDKIRKLFAKENDVDAALFSYNSKGACEECKGNGVVTLNLSFMDDVETVCTTCQGRRYAEEVLAHTFNGKNIVEVLEMDVEQALAFFDAKDLVKKLEILQLVGLSYMSLGQPLSTFSGGECQRLKLAKEMKPGGQLYILDEPTTGLHLQDVSKIVHMLQQLVEQGNTVVVIEHHTDVMRQADWIIDIGPEGGSAGGQIIFEGTPEQLKNCKQSITANYL